MTLSLVLFITCSDITLVKAYISILLQRYGLILASTSRVSPI